VKKLKQIAVEKIMQDGYLFPVGTWGLFNFFLFQRNLLQFKAAVWGFSKAVLGQFDTFPCIRLWLSLLVVLSRPQVVSRVEVRVDMLVVQFS